MVITDDGSEFDENFQNWILIFFSRFLVNFRSAKNSRLEHFLDSFFFLGGSNTLPSENIQIGVEFRVSKIVWTKLQNEITKRSLQTDTL